MHHTKQKAYPHHLTEENVLLRVVLRVFLNHSMLGVLAISHRKLLKWMSTKNGFTYSWLQVNATSGTFNIIQSGHSDLYVLVFFPVNVI